MRSDGVFATVLCKCETGETTSLKNCTFASPQKPRKSGRKRRCGAGRYVWYAICFIRCRGGGLVPPPRDRHRFCSLFPFSKKVPKNGFRDLSILRLLCFSFINLFLHGFSVSEMLGGDPDFFESVRGYGREKTGFTSEKYFTEILEKYRFVGPEKRGNRLYLWSKKFVRGLCVSVGIRFAALRRSQPKRLDRVTTLPPVMCRALFRNPSKQLPFFSVPKIFFRDQSIRSQVPRAYLFDTLWLFGYVSASCLKNQKTNSRESRLRSAA